MTLNVLRSIISCSLRAGCLLLFLGCWDRSRRLRLAIGRCLNLWVAYPLALFLALLLWLVMFFLELLLVSFILLTSDLPEFLAMLHAIKECLVGFGTASLAKVALWYVFLKCRYAHAYIVLPRIALVACDPRFSIRIAGSLCGAADAAYDLLFLGSFFLLAFLTSLLLCGGHLFFQVFRGVLSLGCAGRSSSFFCHEMLVNLVLCQQLECQPQHQAELEVIRAYQPL